VALLGLLAVAVMVFAYVLTSRLNAASQFVGIDRDHNAKVMAQAKRALIGWMAIKAATDNNPGRLPCPEAINSIDTSMEGVSAPQIALPGPPPVPATSSCATVGRLPWRTLGLSKLVDAASEPLWYAVSPGWALQNSSTLLSINSDSQGAMTIDGQAAPNEIVALIIAPGPAMNVAAASGCTALTQTRAAPAPAMNPANYIECFNAATPAFSTTGPATSFNDQVVRVTVADLMPALEGAIAERMQREIAPALGSVYTSSQYSGIPGSSPMYPYAAPWSNPGPGTGTSDYRGVAVTYKGLLPFNQTQGCTAVATNPRCLPSLTAWASPAPAPPPDVTKIGGYGSIQSKTCSWQSSNNVAFCEGEYREDSSNTTGPGMVISMTATINNVAMGLRVLDWTKATIEAENNVSGGAPLTIVTPSTAATMNSNGSVTITFSGTLPNIDVQGWNTYANYRIRLERSVIGDHALLDATTVGAGATGWFVRNQWYRVAYYAAAAANTAAALSSFGCTSSDCLLFNDPSARNIRALLVLAGQSLGNPAGRPNGNLADYLEYQNVDLDTLYEQRPMRRTTLAANPNAPWNDRVILVGWNSPPIVPAQAVTLSPLRLTTLP
jgi:hypothetical protein